jgi:phage shock protein C
MSEPKRLYRNKADAKLGGVLSGIAEYLAVDPTVVRVVYALVTIFTALVPGIVAYLILWLVMPEKPAPASVPPPTAPSPPPRA